MDTRITISSENDPDPTIRVPVQDDRTVVKPVDDITVLVPHPPAQSSARPEVLAPGALVKDRFEIVSILGRGGMGVVYRAIDRRKVEAHDRDPYVALKALSSDFQRDERMMVALQREARKAQTLAHPNIATVYDFDRDGSLVYITMEQLSGEPMDDFIRGHPNGLPPAAVAPILRGLCLALAYAHNKGIVHSDFKPGNVFLNEGKNPKVLDFGIARAAPVSGALTASEQTQFDAGELGALTPSYAALEMFQGAPPHPADDVYALAITAYQLLTGRHPFHALPAPEARAAGLKPEPIKGIRRREWQAIRKGLEFERSARIGHAAEFLRAYEGRSRTRMAIVTAVVLAVAFGLYFGFVQVQEQARVAPDIAFADLPGTTQSAVARYIEDGDKSRKFADHAGALSSYREAYALHPRNPEATERIVSLMQSLVLDARTSSNPDAVVALAANLDDLMATDGFLSTHAELKTLKDQLESVQ